MIRSHNFVTQLITVATCSASLTTLGRWGMARSLTTAWYATQRIAHEARYTTICLLVPRRQACTIAEVVVLKPVVRSATETELAIKVVLGFTLDHFCGESALLE